MGEDELPQEKQALDEIFKGRGWEPANSKDLRIALRKVGFSDAHAVEVMKRIRYDEVEDYGHAAKGRATKKGAEPRGVPTLYYHLERSNLPLGFRPIKWPRSSPIMLEPGLRTSKDIEHNETLRSLLTEFIHRFSNAWPYPQPGGVGRHLPLELEEDRRYKLLRQHLEAGAEFFVLWDGLKQIGTQGVGDVTEARIKLEDQLITEARRLEALDKYPGKCSDCSTAGD